MTKFFKDGAHLLVAQLLARLLAFSLTFVIARTLGLEELALLGLAQSLVGFATVAGDAGLGTSAVQRLARGDNTETVVRETARAQVAISVVASLLLLPLVAAQAGVGIAFALSLGPIAIAATATYVLQARLAARKIAVGQIVGNVVVAAVGISLALLGAPLALVACVYPLGLITTMIIVNLQAGVHARDIFGVPPIGHFAAQSGSYIALLLYTLLVHAYSSYLIIASQNIADGRHFEGVGLASRMLILMVIPAVILGSMLLPRFSGTPPGFAKLAKFAFLAFLSGLSIAGLNFLTAPLYAPLLFGEDASIYVREIQNIGWQVPLSMAATVFTAAGLARRRYLSTGIAYSLGLVSQALFTVIFSSSETPVFVLSIVLSELMFLMCLIAQNALPAIREWRNSDPM